MKKIFNLFIFLSSFLVFILLLQSSFVFAVEDGFDREKLVVWLQSFALGFFLILMFAVYLSWELKSTGKAHKKKRLFEKRRKEESEAMLLDEVNKKKKEAENNGGMH